MKYRFAVLVALLASTLCTLAADKPLRVFIRASNSPQVAGEHDAPRFLQEWTRLLNERGATVTGGQRFPFAAELEQTDVLVLFTGAETGVSESDRKTLERFTKRGGGVVALHDTLGGVEATWSKAVFGGSIQTGSTNTSRGLTGLYFQDFPHPITQGIANFDMQDEIFRKVELSPDAKVLATTFHTAKEIIPQMWVYEKRKARTFVALQGHNQSTFGLPAYRGLILRGIAWAGKRPVDALVRQSELASFPYPTGGPTPPEEAAKKIRVSPEFDLSLVAAEPMVVKPISVDWDPRGRMWVAVTPEYPFKEDKSPAKDAILILEDTNGDGRMDKRSVFYEGLKLVTSFVFHRDGVIVSQAPQILFLRDTNGDGKADKREVLFDGFGTYDTHAVINNLRLGLDGWVYGCQGYSGTQSTNIVNARRQKFG